MQAFLPLNFIINNPGLHRTATRAIDSQDNALGVFVFISIVQATNKTVGIDFAIGFNHTGNFNQSRVIAKRFLALA